MNTDKQLDYRLAYYYNFDAFNARWTWLSELQKGVSTFEDVLLPHNTRTTAAAGANPATTAGKTNVRCVVFDDEGAFGYSPTEVPVSAHADLAAAVDRVFVDGDHTEHIQVFPAALRRMREVDTARHAKRRRALLTRGLLAASTVGVELHKAFTTVKNMLERSVAPSQKLRDAALEMMETYVATSADDAANLPAADLPPVIARTAHDWPDGAADAGTPPGGSADGAW